jgi:hypothetical protein
MTKKHKGSSFDSFLALAEKSGTQVIPMEPLG